MSYNLSAAFPIIRNFSYILVLRILQRVMGFVSLYFIVRALSQDDFGLYQFVLSIGVMLAPLALTGFQNVISQSAARGAIGSFLRLNTLGFLASFSGMVIILAIAGYYQYAGEFNTAIGLCAVAFFFPLRQGLQSWKYYYNGRERFKALSIIAGTMSILIHSSLVILAVLNVDFFLMYVLVTVGVEGLFNLGMTLYVRNSIKVEKHEVYLEEDSLKYGVKTTLYKILNSVASNLDKVLIFIFISPAVTAIFYAAERLSELLKNLVQDLAVTIAPRFARMDEYTKRLNHIIFLFSLIVGALILALAFFAIPVLIPFLFGEEYRDAIPYAQALMCTVAIANGSVLKFRFITSRFDFKGAKVLNYAMSFSRIIASLLFVPIFGIVGAVISVALSRIILMISVEYIIHKDYLKKS